MKIFKINFKFKYKNNKETSKNADTENLLNFFYFNLVI